MIGYETVIKNKKLKEIIEKIMEAENLSFSDFRIQEMRELSLRGSERDLIVEVKKFKAEIEGNDSILSFELPKGSYATVVFEQLIS